MKQAAFAVFAVILIVALLIVSGSFYTVHETEQAIITEFGELKGDPITEAGLKFKIPFIQRVNRFEKRVLAWDGHANEMPTKDKLYILVDTFARWEIQDPRQFFLALRDERSAQSRLDDILGSETRNAVAKHDLIEIIRTTKEREVDVSAVPEGLEELEGGQDEPKISQLEPITKGRSVIEEEIQDNAKDKLAQFGIELLDIRFKRINYNVTVRKRIYERMISERQQIAELFRSEGAAKAARILGDKELELKKIQSEAYKTIQSIRGDADAEATQIYAGAYNQNAQAADFYEFLKTMETYPKVLSEDTTVILSTDSDLFKFLKRMNAETPARGIEAPERDTEAPALDDARDVEDAAARTTEAPQELTVPVPGAY